MGGSEKQRPPAVNGILRQSTGSRAAAKTLKSRIGILNGREGIGVRNQNQFTEHPNFQRADLPRALDNGPVPVESKPQPESPDALLVIGYGSTLRGDDGVGPAVADLVEAHHVPGVQTLACHQLTPELADPIAKARLVIFVDASMDLPDDQVRVSRVLPEASHQVMVHTASPGGLLHLARSVFEACPPAWIVEIPVAEMGIGEHLSPVAQRGVAQATRKVLDLLKSETPAQE
jgi:hydrogenase maturation protease